MPLVTHLLVEVRIRVPQPTTPQEEDRLNTYEKDVDAFAYAIMEALGEAAKALPTEWVVEATRVMG